jgi:hypothetical protein
MNLAKFAILAILVLVAGPVLAAVGMSLSGLLEFVVYIVVISLIFYAVWWFIGYVGIPEPFNKIVRVVIGLVALIIVVNMLLGLAGSPLFTLR